MMDSEGISIKGTFMGQPIDVTITEFTAPEQPDAEPTPPPESTPPPAGNAEEVPEPQAPAPVSTSHKVAGTQPEKNWV